MDISLDEYGERLRGVRERMSQQGLSALMVSDPSNLYYLTGYNAWSFYTAQVLFVPAAGDLVLFARTMDAHGAFRTSWLPQENVFGYPDELVHRAGVHPFDWVGGKLRELGVVAAAAGEQVGLELDSHFFSPKAYRALVAALPEWDFVDSVELVNWVRSVKSLAEIDLMRSAAQIATVAMTTAFEHVRVGSRQCDVAAEISRAQIRGTAEFGGDYPAIVPMMPTGAEADTPHLTWTDAPFEDGQAVIVELAGAYRRYHVPLARTVMLGQPSPELQRVAGAVGEGIQAVLEMVRPGVQARDLATTWERVLATHGLAKPSRIGYSIGIGYPPDWGERTVSLRGEDETVLRENMTFHLIGGMWMDNYGYELSEPMRVTATGVETFTSLPQQLINTGILS
ncbi:M24 family metallopeptidase [Cryobacterium sp. Hh38]|uniref:M24 family metallopeptidase n=1 Tax=Cryobacterium sp. Hh38 TaxID=1259156 RepID=UPI00106B6B43|nr:M24 family metallopeptidase [Cryobacterium sp. Hh38]TFD58184.1 M24 family metallopeptidase [Cryobacterium sp. Hh38]